VNWRPTDERGPWQDREDFGGLQQDGEQANLTLPVTTPQDEPGKAAAIHAYCLGWITLDQCAALFSIHSEWRSA
jgi:hypothetical protein